MDYKDITLEVIEKAVKEMYVNQPVNNRKVKLYCLTKESYNMFCEAMKEEFERRRAEDVDSAHITGQEISSISYATK